MTPNSLTHGDGFHISYNDTDIGIYKDVTTALVFGDMQNFYILNGDHRKAYSAIIGQGFDACMDYFKANISLMNQFSEKPPQVKS